MPDVGRQNGRMKPAIDNTLVILERDGVINEALPGHVRSTGEWLPIAGSLDAIARLGRAGCRVVVATRQPGVRRRHLTIEDITRIHELMYRRLAEYGGTVDAVFICLCLPRHHCECFKPHPGILHAIADRMHVAPDGVPYITARPGDLASALAANARPMLIRAGDGPASPREAPIPGEIDVHPDLASVVDALLAAP